ncbi:MAG: hypothetical protein Q4D62_06215 [Planctomycetia bacterium]|nr:hypothetical protein [Planctomycetia bacterium]
MKRSLFFMTGLLGFLFLPMAVGEETSPATQAPGFYVGAASCDLTPKPPVVLSGHLATLIADKVATPLTANVIAMESIAEDGTNDYAIFVTMDTCSIRIDFYKAFCQAFEKACPQWDVRKVILNATHTHNAPDIRADGYYSIGRDDVMKSSVYTQFCLDRMIPAIQKAWESRTPGKYAYGLDFAVVAYNRRSVFADGHAEMYGKTNNPNFRAIEGMEDHDVGTLFFWNDQDKLIAMMVNVACPSQENEGRLEMDADYWAPTRKMLQKKYGEDLVVLGLCGAAGDMSPHTQYRRGAEDRMSSMRKRTRVEEMARRIVGAVDATWEVVAGTREVPAVMKNLYAEIELPQRKITEQEYKSALAEALRLEKIVADAKPGEQTGAFSQAKWYRRVTDRWDQQQENPNQVYPTCIRVVRIGDTVLCSNQFELFTDFGVQIKARSPARQTFIVQLSNGLVGAGTYVPSKRAVKGGGYSAIPQSNMVGPEGGQVLVEKTLEMANQLFPKK